MAKGTDCLVLEIFRQGDLLKMSIFEQNELASTLRQYSQCRISLEEINRICQELTRILNKANRKGLLATELADNLSRTGQLIWESMFSRSVKDGLAAAEFKDLVLLLDEELVNIPWELAFDRKEFLCLRFNLGRLVKVKEKPISPQYRSLSSPLKMLILANPTNDLEAAYYEGLYIKNKFKGKEDIINIDFKSTQIDTIYVKKYLRDYDLVHFAGHCEYDKFEAHNSGWVLNNGRFTSNDIHSMAENSLLPSLVFSNGCQSAQICDGLIESDYEQQAYNLASAFLFSGVRHYIGAIRKIEDSVSVIFAWEFYSQLIRGNSVGESIRKSRIKLIEQFGKNSIFWAGYILYGSPNYSLLDCARQKALQGRKPARRVSIFKEYRKAILAGVSGIVISTFAYFSLPTRYPGVFLLFQKTRQLFMKGLNQEAIAGCRQIISIDPLFLRVYPQLAETYLRQGKREDALRCYFEYALNSQKKQDKRSLASAYTGIGWIYHQLGEYAKALDFYRKSIALSSESRDRLNEAVALRKLAVWYIDNDDNNKALELLTKSSEINRERQKIFEHKYNLACDYFDLGLLFSNKDDYPTAKEFYAKSQEIFESLRLRNELSDCYFNLGEIYLFEKKYEKALDNYSRGLKIDLLHGNLPSLAGDYDMFGELFMQMDDLGKAEENFLRAAAICKEINGQSELAAVNYNFGLIYKKRHMKNKAREYFRQAQEFYHSANLPEYQKIKQELSELDG